MKKLFLIFCVLFCSPAFAVNEHASPQSTARLILLPGPQPGAIQVYLKIELKGNWHTYWQNPGHAGLPPQFEITTTPAATVGEMQYAVPERIQNGPLVTFGYHKEAWFMREIQIPQDKINEKFSLSAKLRYLVCDQQCLQEKAELTVALPNAEVVLDGIPAIGGIWPKPLGAFDPVLEKGKDGNFALHVYRNIDVDGGWVVNLQITDFFPARGMPIDLAKPQIEEKSIEHDVLTLKPSDITGKPVRFQGLLVGKDRTTGAVSAFWLDLDWPK